MLQLQDGQGNAATGDVNQEAASNQAETQPEESKEPDQKLSAKERIEKMKRDLQAKK